MCAGAVGAWRGGGRGARGPEEQGRKCVFWKRNLGHGHGKGEQGMPPREMAEAGAATRDWANQRGEGRQLGGFMDAAS